MVSIINTYGNITNTICFPDSKAKARYISEEKEYCDNYNATSPLDIYVNRMLFAHISGYIKDKNNRWYKPSLHYNY